MAVLNRRMRLDFSADGPSEARATIRDTLQVEPQSTRKVYAALAHKVWTLLIDRRFDDEIRDWHSVLQGVRGAIALRDQTAAERIVALSDLITESISFGETSSARQLAERPQARRILNMLGQTGDFVPRRRLLADLGIKSAHLSNVLTQLSAHSLIARRDRGKEAEFWLTQHGRELIGADAVGTGTSMAAMMEAIGARAIEKLGKSRHFEDLFSFGIAPVSLDSDEHRSRLPIADHDRRSFSLLNRRVYLGGTGGDEALGFDHGRPPAEQSLQPQFTRQYR